MSSAYTKMPNSIVYRNRFYVLWKNNTNGQIWIGEVDMKKGEYKKTRMLR